MVDVARDVLRAFAVSPPDCGALDQTLARLRAGLRAVAAMAPNRRDTATWRALTRLAALLENQIAARQRDATSAAGFTNLCARLNAFDAATRDGARASPAIRPPRDARATAPSADRARAIAAVERQARALAWALGDSPHALSRLLKDVAAAGEGPCRIVAAALRLLGTRQARRAASAISLRVHLRSPAAPAAPRRSRAGRS